MKNPNSVFSTSYSGLQSLPPQLQDMLQHAMEVRQRCLDLESAVAAVNKNDNTISFFPITVSRRPNSISNIHQETRETGAPSKSITQDQSSTNYNCNSPPNLVLPIRLTESLLSCTTVDTVMSTGSCQQRNNKRARSVKEGGSMSCTSNASLDRCDVIKSVTLPNIGVAAHLRSGDIWIRYQDQTQLLVQSTTNKLLYTHSNGQCERFGHGARLPPYVKKKLSRLPCVVEILLKTET